MGNNCVSEFYEAKIIFENIHGEKTYLFGHISVKAWGGGLFWTPPLSLYFCFNFRLRSSCSTNPMWMRSNTEQTKSRRQRYISTFSPLLNIGPKSHLFLNPGGGCWFILYSHWYKMTNKNRTVKECIARLSGLNCVLSSTLTISFVNCRYG